MDDGEGAVGIILKLLHGDATAEAAATRQFSCMVEEIAVTLEVGHAAVVRKRLGVFQRHNLTTISPGSLKRRSRGVGNMLRHATGGIEQVVEGLRLLGGPSLLIEREDIAAQDPRSLGIGVLILHALITLLHIGSAEALDGLVDLLYLAVEREHVFIQLGIVDGGVAPEEPRLPVKVDEDGGVDIIPAAVVEERLAQGILERPGGRVGHGHADSHAIGQLGVGADVPIELAIALDALRGPGTVVGPAETGQTEQRPMVSPVHHVTAGIDTPFVHPEEVCMVFVMTGIDIHSVAIDHRCRVTGKPRLHKGVLRSYAAKEKRKNDK